MAAAMQLTISTNFYLETRTGGRVRYQAERLGPLELLLTVFLFLVSVVVSVATIEVNARPVTRLPAPRAVATWQGVGAIWTRQWLRGIIGR